MAFFSWRQWPPRLSGPTRRSPYARPRQRSRRLELESLEPRLAPATFIWSGAGGMANEKWSNAANWVGGTAPTGAAGTLDDLVFDSRASQRTSVDDLAPAGGNAVF